MDILSPTLTYVESLYLVRNNCKRICSEHKIDKQVWKNLRYLNLEQNGIESWDELVGFRELNDLRQLIVNKNQIKAIYHKPGFRGLRQFSFEHNQLRSFKSFDALNLFDSRIEQIRCQGNPVIMAGKELGEDENVPEMNEEEADEARKRSKAVVIGRNEFLKKYNGGSIEPSERKDFELYYLKSAYEHYLRVILQVKDDKDRKVDSLDDEGLLAYVSEYHHRFFELVSIYGSPLGMVNITKEGKNIK